MTMYFRRITELDLDDPRRWVRPPADERREYWDKGLVMVSAPEFYLSHLERENKGNKAQEPCTPSLQQQEKNYGRWLPRHIRAGLPPSKRTAKRPCPAKGVDTNDSHAHPSAHSAVLSCNCCGVTHWRRNCPIRHQNVPHT